MPKDTRDVADVTTEPATASAGKTAVLYRMALPNHLCPAGQKARWLLKRKGFEVDDRLFRERPEVDAFKKGNSQAPQRISGFGLLLRR
jgi:hypothetical protein